MPAQQKSKRWPVQGFSGQTIPEYRAKPADQSLWIRLFYFRPIHQDEGKRPRRQDPPDRPAHPHNAKFLLASFILANAIELVMEIVGT